MVVSINPNLIPLNTHHHLYTLPIPNFFPTSYLCSTISRFLSHNATLSLLLDFSFIGRQSTPNPQFRPSRSLPFSYLEGLHGLTSLSFGSKVTSLQLLSSWVYSICWIALWCVPTCISFLVLALTYFKIILVWHNLYFAYQMASNDPDGSLRKAALCQRLGQLCSEQEIDIWEEEPPPETPPALPLIIPFKPPLVDGDANPMPRPRNLHLPSEPKNQQHFHQNALK